MGKPYSEVTAAFLPSSLRTSHSFVLVYSTWSPVSVCGTGSHTIILEAFLGSVLMWLRSGEPLHDPCLIFVIKDTETDLPISDTRHVYHNPISGPHYYTSSLLRLYKKLRNINLMSIDCGFRHDLRTRLTLGWSPLPRKPWSFDGRGSHPACGYLCQHSYFCTLHYGSRL